MATLHASVRRSLRFKKGTLTIRPLIHIWRTTSITGSPALRLASLFLSHWKDLVRNSKVQFKLVATGGRWPQHDLWRVQSDAFTFVNMILVIMRLFRPRAVCGRRLLCYGVTLMNGGMMDVRWDNKITVERLSTNPSATTNAFLEPYSKEFQYNKWKKNPCLPTKFGMHVITKSQHIQIVGFANYIHFVQLNHYKRQK